MCIQVFDENDLFVPSSFSRSAPIAATLPAVRATAQEEAKRTAMHREVHLCMSVSTSVFVSGGFIASHVENDDNTFKNLVVADKTGDLHS